METPRDAHKEVETVRSKDRDKKEIGDTTQQNPSNPLRKSLRTCLQKRRDRWVLQ